MKPRMFASLLCTLALLHPGLAQVPKTSPQTSTKSTQPLREPEPEPLVSTGTSALIPVPSQSLAAGGGSSFFNPTLQYSVQYGNGLPVSPDLTAKTAVHQLSPGISIRFAERSKLTYSATVTRYSNDTIDGHTDHNFDARVAGQVGDVALDIRQTAIRSSVALFETGGLTEQDAFGTQIQANYDLGLKTQLEGQVGQTLRFSETTDLRKWDGFGWWRYAVSPTLNLAAGAGGSYNSIKPGADLISRQVKASLGWTPVERFSVEIESGVDVVRFLDSRDGDFTTPIFEAQLRYQIFEATSLSLTTRRSVDASYFANQAIDTTQYRAGITQRLLGRLYLSLNIMRSESEYLTKDPAALFFDRQDKFWSANVQLSTEVATRATVSLSWQKGRNQSNRTAFDRESDFIGGSIGWRF